MSEGGKKRKKLEVQEIWDAVVLKDKVGEEHLKLRRRWTPMSGGREEGGLGRKSFHLHGRAKSLSQTTGDTQSKRVHYSATLGRNGWSLVPHHAPLLPGEAGCGLSGPQGYVSWRL